MLRERPIRRHNRGPATAEAVTPATGGEDLTDFIVRADVLRQELRYQRWADLVPLCDGEDPKTLDRCGLVKLIVKLRQEKRERAGQLPLLGGAIDG